MYVYLIKFDSNPNLVKIGKSIIPEDRAIQLSKTHGKPIFKKFFDIGKDYSCVERLLHIKFASDRLRVAGDGGTEFFNDRIAIDAEEFLTQYNPTQLASYELEMEEIRYNNLIGKLLGYKSSNSYTGENSLYCGWTDIIRIGAAIELGFLEQEVFSRHISTNLDPHRSKRFTTPSRVGMAWRLSQQGSSKYNKLKLR